MSGVTVVDVTVGGAFLCTGAYECSQVNVIDPSALTCTAPVTPVGRHSVVVVFNGQSSSGAVAIARTCAAAQFAPLGQYCDSCPRVSAATA
jgi:hypothetical protein